MSKPVFELARVVREYRQSFIEKYNLLKQHLSVLHAIEQCRTSALGGHVDVCEGCHHLRIIIIPAVTGIVPNVKVPAGKMDRSSAGKPAARYLLSCGIYITTGVECVLPPVS